jgi:hypothetical protein
MQRLLESLSWLIVNANNSGLLQRALEYLSLNEMQLSTRVQKWGYVSVNLVSSHSSYALVVRLEQHWRYYFTNLVPGRESSTVF